MANPWLRETFAIPGVAGQEKKKKKESRNVHQLRSAPMQGGRAAAAAAQGFTAEGGDLCGYEGGRRGPSHPENADPGLASGDIELSTP